MKKILTSVLLCACLIVSMNAGVVHAGNYYLGQEICGSHEASLIQYYYNSNNGYMQPNISYLLYDGNNDFWDLGNGGSQYAFSVNLRNSADIKLVAEVYSWNDVLLGRYTNQNTAFYGTTVTVPKMWMASKMRVYVVSTTGAQISDYGLFNQTLVLGY